MIGMVLIVWVLVIVLILTVNYAIHKNDTED